ncbi:MAG: YraN family protein [Eubacteriales bacterium]|nr:YraN family protein [Eubacteriales bacterium]MDD3880749.1 YraN family protein [Eubacteriales bacterium]MDD3882904.1 YraN family protein [Eubacteriales bacterium]MDD4511618.1 YraN family protein [Eubacteriales bacterium]
MRTSYDSGLAGESAAREYLEKKGYKFVASRWRCPYGEIDLVMKMKGTIVFVEVKVGAGSIGSGAERIDSRKLLRLTRSADAYLRENCPSALYRLDAVEVRPDGVSHWENLTI